MVFTNTEDKFIHPQIWRSRLLWRISLSLFVTFLAIQTCVFYFSHTNYKRLIEANIETSSRSMINTLISRQFNGSQEFDPVAIAQTIVNNSRIAGVVIFNQRGEILAAEGERIENARDPFHWHKAHLAEDWSRYEFALTPSDVGQPYRFLLRVDSGQIKPLTIDHAKDNFKILFALAVLVTFLLMVILSRWLLEPIITLRYNMDGAAKDPENPERYLTSFNSDDEIGIVVRSANEMIYQNAENIKAMKDQAKDTIHQLAYYDNLTGLPNRILYLQQLEKTIYVTQSRKEKKVAVAVVDLDHFKDINDTMGHQAGDQILAAVGNRLKEKLPKDFYVSRTGEDEFAIISVMHEQDSLADKLTKMILEAMKEPFKAVGEEFQIRVSIGVACFPQDGSEANKLLKSADIALNQAKQEGRGTVRYYSADFDEAVSQRFNMLRHMRQAIENNDFDLFYQPQYDLRTGKMIGAEALIRWFKREEGKAERVMVSPADFIPVAEQSGLIIPIGRWVLKEACTKALQIQKLTKNPFRIAINLSAVQMQEQNLIPDIKQILRETEIDPAKVELEVTESVFMDDVNRTISTMNSMKDLGVELAIDDFGTGYSNLSYLRQFPIDRLKVDQSFIRNALENKDDAAIAKTIIKLGQALGVKVIAEGVETSEHEAFLKAQDCDEVQGYFYAKPMPFEAFVEYLLEFEGKAGKIEIESA